MKKISFLIGSLGGGGAERVCVTLANGLARLGWDIDIVVLHLDESVFDQDLLPHIQLTVLGANHARFSGVKLAQYLYRKRPSHFLVFDHTLAVLLVLLRVILPLNYRILARNINTLGQEAKQVKSIWYKYIVKWITKSFYRYVDCIIAQSKGMAEDLIRSYFIDKEKVVVVNNPMAPAIEKYSLRRDTILNQHFKQNYLLCVGRLEPQKAFHYAITAFAKVATNFPWLNLKIVGKGRLLDSLKDLSFQLDVGERVEFEGFQRNIIPYYLGARLTLLTSIYEGFPNVLVESIALGTPVIAFDCDSGPDEIIEPGVNGYLCKYQDINDLVYLIEKSLHKQWQPNEVILTSKSYQSAHIIDAYEKVLSKL